MKKRNIQRLLTGVFAAVIALTLVFCCAACGNGSSNVPNTGTEITLPDGGSTDPDGGSTDPDGGSTDPVTPEWATEYGLPDAEQALAKLYEIYGGESKIYLLQKGKIARMPCPRGEEISLNMQYEAGEYTKLVLEDCVAEFNEVFAVINPNYKFKINYSPSAEDLSKKYSVKMSAAQNLAVTETSEVFGYAHISYYANFTELGGFGITIKNEVLNNGSYLMTTFKHELMHLLGAGDAYKNSEAAHSTVMQSYTVGGYHHFSRTDVAFLDALYRNPALKITNAQMQEYIDGYEQNTTHTRANLTAAVYAKLADGIDGGELAEQAANIGYKDLTEFTAQANVINRDAQFGSYAISFTEIEYAEKPAETYYGSIDPDKNIYWHGRQTSLGSAQGIKYTNYGSGIVYAAPNGNLYTIIIKTGDFVLAFRLSGGFTDFASLSLNLWHISK